MRPDQPERRLRERLDALGPAPRAELLHVLMLPIPSARTCLDVFEEATVRNLPASLAGAAFDPVVVALVGDLQQDPNHGRIGLADELALP